jgi:hypothetical protein
MAKRIAVGDDGSVNYGDQDLTEGLQAFAKSKEGALFMPPPAVRKPAVATVQPITIPSRQPDQLPVFGAPMQAENKQAVFNDLMAKLTTQS